MWRYVQTTAWLQPEAQPEPKTDRSSLYITNGDAMQTAAVWTAAVCLVHYSNQTLFVIALMSNYELVDERIQTDNLDDQLLMLYWVNWQLQHSHSIINFL